MNFWRCASCFRCYWLLVPLAGCAPDIGDACEISNDCAETGDRICDPTQPGGYCTIFNCEPGGCPDEAVCIAFGSNVSAAPGCTNPSGGSRFRRTFCMFSCDDGDDCRSGYTCADLNKADNAWGASLAETRSVSARVCIAPFTGEQIDPDTVKTEVCTGTDKDFPMPPISDAGADVMTDAAGGVSGFGGVSSGGVGGAGGTGGMNVGGAGGM